MEQILDIGDGTPPKEGEEIPAPRKVVSGTIPFMDTSPYTADNSTPNEPEPRHEDRNSLPPPHPEPR